MRFATRSAKRAAMPSRSARSRSGAMSSRWLCGGWDNRSIEMKRRYITVDVFTDRAFGGNQLAVVLDAGGLSTQQMQAIATEFNYSETTFVLPPRDKANDAEVRIFTPVREMPFAGHPNIGTSFVLAS